ncbi:hypothetical protein NPIL_660621 [Nephila pilipes]|uniref:Uncharacterized protein n=1 Tax=Nephila pilipes TaxID=299642 RepID=A0A8X6N9E7_NEPPI|nr:hypothetical protein NPIL_432781 [Nephila pilipes]GFU22039.1 hypothetical protein NPIL_660621 [Nephila pilipes]
MQVTRDSHQQHLGNGETVRTRNLQRSYEASVEKQIKRKCKVDDISRHELADKEKKGRRRKSYFPYISSLIFNGSVFRDPGGKEANNVARRTLALTMNGFLDNDYICSTTSFGD